MPSTGSGNPSARLMLVGEAFGADEERAGQPFVGASGQELNRMLQEAGLSRSEAYTTNVVNARPPHNDFGAWVARTKKEVTPVHVRLRDRMVLPIVTQGMESLRREIDLIHPQVIIALGNWAMWALTGAFGILKWRGSLLDWDGPGRYRVIPTIHPAAVLRSWDYRAIALLDLKRARTELQARTPAPQWKFKVRPTLDEVRSHLEWLIAEANLHIGYNPIWLDLDLETRAGHIACCGLSWSREGAISIPFMCVEKLSGYWTEEEEAYVIYALWRLLTHPAVRCRLQNGLYDFQYIWRHWHFLPRFGQDTMIAHHSMWAALPKSLAFQASMYSPHYVYWKDDGRTWAEEQSEDTLWKYNCQDCVRTRECGEAQTAAIPAMGLQAVDDFQQSMFLPVLDAMLRGIRVLPEAVKRLDKEIGDELKAREEFLEAALGHPINVRSSPQMQELFYSDLGQRPITKKVKNSKSGVFEMKPTCDDEALRTIAQREPLMLPLTNAIADIRTLAKLRADFVQMPLDVDGRMRCSFNIAGNAELDDPTSKSGKGAPYSYRLSASVNAFGSGGNLQTIPSEKSKSAGKASARGTRIPNIREMYAPDPGYTMFDLDLDRADLQVVVWESNDEMLKAALRSGVDIHLLNTYTLDGVDPPPLEELVEGSARYADHRGPRKYKREFSKVFCHATNYLGKATTVAAHTGRLVSEIERAQRSWFRAHPGILAWHQRVITQVRTHRFIENPFGYRWYIFDRIDEQLYPKAVAWVPQSTVGCVINRIWRRIYDNLPEVQVLLQVHDSLVGQYPTEMEGVPALLQQEASRVVVPYPDPLVIPVGVKTSVVSWGNCA